MLICLNVISCARWKLIKWLVKVSILPQQPQCYSCEIEMRRKEKKRNKISKKWVTKARQIHNLLLYFVS